MKFQIFILANPWITLFFLKVEPVRMFPWMDCLKNLINLLLAKTICRILIKTLTPIRPRITMPMKRINPAFHLLSVVIQAAVKALSLHLGFLILNKTSKIVIIPKVNSTNAHSVLFILSGVPHPAFMQSLCSVDY